MSRVDGTSGSGRRGSGDAGARRGGAAPWRVGRSGAGGRRAAAGDLLPGRRRARRLPRRQLCGRTCVGEPGGGPRHCARVQERRNGPSCGDPGALLALARRAAGRRSGWRRPMPIHGCRRTGSRSSWRPIARGRICGQAGYASPRRAPSHCSGRRRTPPRGVRSTAPAWGSAAPSMSSIGGFRCLRSGEDRDFHRRAVAAGFRVTYDLRAAVTTSARRTGRAPGGFASVLDGVEGEQLEASA